MVSVQLREGKNDVSAEERIDVLRHEFGVTTAVLRPVGVVADSSWATLKVTDVHTYASQSVDHTHTHTHTSNYLVRFYI